MFVLPARIRPALVRGPDSAWCRWCLQPRRRPPLQDSEDSPVTRTPFGASDGVRCSPPARTMPFVAAATLLWALAGCGDGAPGAAAAGRRGAAAARSRRGHRRDRRPTALVTELPGRARGLARGAGARARDRHRAQAPVPRRQRRQGRPGAVPDRPRAVPGGARQRQGRSWRGAGQRDAGRRRRPSATSRWSRPTPISEQDYVNAQAAQQQAEADVAAASAARADGADQPRLRHGDGADLRPHRPRAGHRRRAGGAGRGDAAGADPADRPDVRQLHAVGGRGAAPAPGGGAGSASARRRCGRRCAWCSTTAASCRSRASCCSPT